MARHTLYSMLVLGLLPTTLQAFVLPINPSPSRCLTRRFDAPSSEVLEYLQREKLGAWIPATMDIPPSASEPQPRPQYQQPQARRERRPSLHKKPEDDEDCQIMCISTFNILAPCYKRLPPTPSEFMWPSPPPRESEQPSLWQERAWELAEFIKDQLNDSEIICLQEYWSEPGYQAVFEEVLGPIYDFYFYQRPNSKADGLAVLVRRQGLFEVKQIEGHNFETAGSRVALLVHLVEKSNRSASHRPREVLLLNTHLTFPHHAIDRNSQMMQVVAINRILEDWPYDLPPGSLQIVAGDFNVERGDPVCCFMAQQGFKNTMGQVNPARFVSHRNHLRQEVGVDHVFVREVPHLRFLPPPTPPRPLQQQDEEKARPVVSLVGEHVEESLCKYSTTSIKKKEDELVEVMEAWVHPRDLPDSAWEHSFTMSDHRPVSAVLRLKPRRSSSTPPPPPVPSS